LDFVVVLYGHLRLTQDSYDVVATLSINYIM